MLPVGLFWSTESWKWLGNRLVFMLTGARSVLPSFHSCCDDRNKNFLWPCSFTSSSRPVAVLSVWVLLLLNTIVTIACTWVADSAAVGNFSWFVPSWGCDVIIFGEVKESHSQYKNTEKAKTTVLEDDGQWENQKTWGLACRVTPSRCLGFLCLLQCYLSSFPSWFTTSVLPSQSFYIYYKKCEFDTLLATFSFMFSNSWCFQITNLSCRSGINAHPHTVC